MHKKFEVNQTKIKGGCQLERKAAEMKSYSKMHPANDSCDVVICGDLLTSLEIYLPT